MEIQESSDYGRFKFLSNNRKIVKGHVTQIVEALKKKPSGLRYRPILTNEKLEIIDGQHRFEAVKQLGYPVYYVVGKGLGYRDAQVFNALQKNWGPVDYAESYAKAGDSNYQYYLDIRERYGLTHNVAVIYLTGNSTDVEGFRNGSFKVSDLDVAEALIRLLVDVSNYWPDYWLNKSFGVAFYTLITHPDYDHKVFMSRVENGKKWLSRFETTQDYQRVLEKIYNNRTPLEKQIKLF